MLSRARRYIADRLTPARSEPIGTVQSDHAVPKDFSSRRSLALPEGVSREDIYSLLGSMSIDEAPPTEIAAYLAEDFERFVITWGLTSGCAGSALEIGANPYFTTLMLVEYSELEVELTNFFTAGDPFAVQSQRIHYTRCDGEAVERELAYRSVNVELDRFPYEDDSFDVVLFCEVIEHLQLDPVAALSEVRRVLRSGGRLILSTPNVARLENVARLIAGANIYDPYSGYGPYGRHNREYTRHELHRLLNYCGFGSIDSFTADVHEHQADHFVELDRFWGLVSDRSPDLGQYLFVQATNTDAPTPDRRPSMFYRSLPEGAIEPYE